MKKFFARNGELLFVVLIVVLILAGLIFYTLSGGDFGLGNRVNNGQTNENGTSTPNGETSKEQQGDTEVRLNDGRTIKVGDRIMMSAPTYDKVLNTIEGTVTKVYPERKRVLLWEPTGVVEFAYRYVVELRATRVISSNGPSVGLTFTDTVRGGVMMNEQGEELVHFLQDLDNPAWEWRYRAVRVDETEAYTNRLIYNVVDGGDNVPGYIKKFYDDHAPKTQE